MLSPTILPDSAIPAKRSWRTVARRILLVPVVLASCSESATAPTFGRPTRMLALDGANQRGVAGRNSPVVPSVLVLDDENRPVPGVVVTFTTESGGTIQTPTSTTDSRGTATAGAWTLGSSFGMRLLTATAAGLAPVSFIISAIAPDTGVGAFAVSDLRGDTLAPTPVGLARAHDVIDTRGEFRRDTLVLTLTFAGPVGPASVGGPTAVAGVIEIDIDSNAATGGRASSNSFGASANVGVDYSISLFNATATTVTIEAFPGGVPVAVPAAFSANSLVIRVPFNLIGNDDGSFAVVGLVGTADRPTDFFPNTGAIAARPSGGG